MSDTYTNNRTGDQFQCLENTTFFDGSGRMVTTLVPIQKEPERWRAKRNGWYWYVDSDLIPRSLLERGTPSDEGRHDTNNYFSSQNQAQLAADAIRELLRIIHTQGTILGYNDLVVALEAMHRAMEKS